MKGRKLLREGQMNESNLFSLSRGKGYGEALIESLVKISLKPGQKSVIGMHDGLTKFSAAWKLYEDLVMTGFQQKRLAGCYRTTVSLLGVKGICLVLMNRWMAWIRCLQGSCYDKGFGKKDDEAVQEEAKVLLFALNGTKNWRRRMERGALHGISPI